MNNSKNLMSLVIRESLNEDAPSFKIPKPNKSFLYHGSNIKNLKSIQTYGLLPDFGNTIKGTEMFAYYMDDEYFSKDDRVEGVLFFSDNPDTWSYSHYGGTADINDAILIIVKNNDTIFKKNGDYIYDMNGQKVESIKYNRSNYLSVDKIPPFIENTDYFSFDEQDIFDVLYGQRLINYVKQFS